MNYNVAPNGRFIMIRRGVNGGKLRVVVNWTEELEGNSRGGRGALAGKRPIIFFDEVTPPKRPLQ